MARPFRVFLVVAGAVLISAPLSILATILPFSVPVVIRGIHGN